MYPVCVLHRIPSLLAKSYNTLPFFSAFCYIAKSYDTLPHSSTLFTSQGLPKTSLLYKEQERGKLKTLTSKDEQFLTPTRVLSNLSPTDKQSRVLTIMHDIEGLRHAYRVLFICTPLP